ncbi:MAG: CRISPR-associated helicase Cas3' [Candidatus Bathyarchaeia archaeon]
MVLSGGQPYPHQLETVKNIANGKSVVLRAPCGSGKTEACYISLLAMRKVENSPVRMIYSLPTRALVEDVCYRINRGIKKLGFPLAVSPQHGASSMDPFFRSDIVVATIDQTVGAYCCTPLSLPVYQGNIPAGAVVSSFLCFDEVHVYDHLLGLQSAIVLLDHVANLGLPFIVMSATLPDSFIEWFGNSEKFVDKVKIVEASDNDVPKRYNRQVTLHWKGKILEAKDIIESSKSFNRIIVACNTVDRAQTFYRNIKKELSLANFNVFLLHSRFLEADRANIEQMVKTFLEKQDEKTCVVTTQVCEVGLDISCDLLLTELAPPDALVQRVGRCARGGGRGVVEVFDVENAAPYEKETINDCRDYICNNLNGKKVGWNEELAFINKLLSNEFEKILQDENLRRNLRFALGNAAFKGDRRAVEKTVREVFSANLTVHENPFELTYNELLNMPWLNIHVGVLKNYLQKIWHIEFGHDEYGKHKLNVKKADKLYPYEFYVIPPECAEYSSELGLVLGLNGENLKTQTHTPLQKLAYEYPQEPWEQHVDNCLKAFEKIKKDELHSLRLLAKLLNSDFRRSEGLIALCLAVHDLGKLNISWQREIGVCGKGAVPLAHTFMKPKTVPHATIAAYATRKIFYELIGNQRFTTSFELAIAHHHHTRAEEVPQYILGWKDLYERVLTKVAKKYDLGVSKISESIITEIPYKTKLDIPFPDIEHKKQYAVYCIASRLTRICDRASFTV